MKLTMRLSGGGLAVCAIAALCLTAADVRADLLVNPGFEDPVTSDGPPFVGFWEAFNAGAGSGAFNSTVSPRSGAQHLELVIPGAANLFAGVFQDVSGLSAGQIVSWSGWARDVGTDPGGSEVRIEWRDSVGNVEISRTPNLVPLLTDQYTQWSLVDTVPAGADLARVVFAIQSFGGALNQNIYVDDTSLTVVPEPSSVALLGLGAVLILLRRRRG